MARREYGRFGMRPCRFREAEEVAAVRHFYVIPGTQLRAGK
jgi:hypothetical protein